MISKRGLIQVYTGEGKGKTTAAIGLAIRACGHGMRAHIIQFMKGATYTGEYNIAKNFVPNLSITQFGKDCPYGKEIIKNDTLYCNGCRECFMTNEESIKRAKQALEFAKKTISKGKYDIVILDEVNMAMDMKLIKQKDVLEAVRKRQPHMEVILTGRGAPKDVIKAADLVTYMKDVKHPITKGIKSRKGIEF